MAPSKISLALLINSAVALSLVLVGLPAHAQASVWVQKNAAAKASYESADFTNAEQGWLEALRQARAIGQTDPRVAETLSELGTLYQRTERYEESVATLRGALRIKQSIYGPDSPELRTDLETYQSSLRLLGEDELADAAALRLERILLLHPQGTPERAVAKQVPLATPRETAQDGAKAALNTPNLHEAAERALDELKMRDRSGKTESTAVASVGHVIEELTKTGDAASAEQAANNALTELQKAKGYQSTEVAYILSLRATALRAQGNGAAALDDATRANNIYANVTRAVERSAFRTAALSGRHPFSSTHRAGRDLDATQDDAIAWRSKIVSLASAEESSIKQMEQSEMQSLEARQRAALLASRRYRMVFVH